MEEETVACLETCHSLEASRLVNYTPNFSGILERIQKFKNHTISFIHHIIQL